MAKLREEYNNFIKDMEKNLKNKEDLEYIKVRFSMFVDKIIDEIDMILDYKTKKMSELEQKQKEIESLQIKILELIEKDPYITQNSISQVLKIGRTTVTENIKKLKDAKFIERIGSDRKGYWKKL